MCLKFFKSLWKISRKFMENFENMNFDGFRRGVIECNENIYKNSMDPCKISKSFVNF